MAKDPCWKGYRQLGMKKKNGKEVPNCVPVKEESEKHEKEEMALLKRLEKKTDKLIKKDSKVHKVLEGWHARYYRKPGIAYGKHTEPKHDLTAKPDDSERLKKRDDESHEEYNKRLGDHILKSVLKRGK